MKSIHLLTGLSLVLLVPLAAASPTFDDTPDEHCVTNVGENVYGQPYDVCAGGRDTPDTVCHGVWTRSHGNGPGAPEDVSENGTYVCQFYYCTPATPWICGVALCRSDDIQQADGMDYSSGTCTGVIDTCTGYSWSSRRDPPGPWQYPWGDPQWSCF